MEFHYARKKYPLGAKRVGFGLRQSERNNMNSSGKEFQNHDLFMDKICRAGICASSRRRMCMYLCRQRSFAGCELVDRAKL